MNYLSHIIVAFSLQAMFAMSLNLVAGYGGMLSLAHASFAAIGAYTCALLGLKLGWSLMPSLFIGPIIVWAIASLFARPVLRWRGDYFVLGTLAFQVVITSLLENGEDWTGGVYGLAGLAVPTLLGFSIDSPPAFAFLASAFALMFFAFLRWMVRSPFGLLLRATRDDDLAAVSLGKDVEAVKRHAFVCGATLAALPGALFAAYTRYVDPSMFSPLESIFLLTIVFVGGAGTLSGPLLGAALMTLVPEFLRMFRLEGPGAASLRQVLFALLLICVLRWKPSGLAGGPSPKARHV
jgi:branched-chain amino acid transport system permease protein